MGGSSAALDGDRLPGKQPLCFLPASWLSRVGVVGQHSTPSRAPGLRQHRLQEVRGRDFALAGCRNCETLLANELARSPLTKNNAGGKNFCGLSPWKRALIGCVIHTRADDGLSQPPGVVLSCALSACRVMSCRILRQHREPFLRMSALPPAL